MAILEAASAFIASHSGLIPSFVHLSSGGVRELASQGPLCWAPVSWANGVGHVFDAEAEEEGQGRSPAAEASLKQNAVRRNYCAGTDARQVFRRNQVSRREEAPCVDCSHEEDRSVYQDAKGRRHIFGQRTHALASREYGSVASCCGGEFLLLGFPDGNNREASIPSCYCAESCRRRLFEALLYSIEMISSRCCIVRAPYPAVGLFIFFCS